MNNIGHTGWKAFALLFVLAFSMNTLLMLSGTYSDALFLSTYPREWLTWYFLANPLVTILLYFFFTSYLAKTQPRQSFIFIIATLVALLIIYELIGTQLYAVPFILCLCLSISGKLIYILGWNAIAGALDIGVFKQHVFRLNTIGSIGQISICFLTPTIIHFFHNNGVFFATIIAYVFTAFCIKALKPLTAGIVKPQHQLDSALNKQYFFRVLFILTIVTIIVDTLVNYSYRSALMGHFTQDGLATFISLFNGFLSAASVITELLIASRLLFWVGISGILLLTPIVCIIFGTIGALWPSFISMMILRATQTFFRNNFTTPFMQVIVCPYPSILRKKASLYLSGYATPIGAILGVSIIFIIRTWLSIHFYGIFIVVTSLCWIAINSKIRSGYQEMLYASLKENRYDPDLLGLTSESVSLMREDILDALKSKDINIVRTALDFFAQKAYLRRPHDLEIQQAINKELSDPEMDVRYKATKALKNLHATASTSALQHQLNCEKDARVGWAIVDTLYFLNALPSPSQAKKYLQSMQPFKVAYGLIALDQADHPRLHKKALDEFTRLVNGSIDDKLLLASTESYLQPTAEHNQQLQKLMQDKSDEVSIRAIKAITSKSSTEFTSLLLTFLNSKNKCWYAEKALENYKDKILDQLLAINLDAPKRQLLSMVRLLTKPPSLVALTKLIELSKSPSLSLRLFIARSVLHNSQYDLTKTAFIDAIVELIEWIASEISGLLQLDAGNNKALKLEIDVQLTINRRAFIIWFSLLTDKNRVTAVAHYIENPSHYNSADLAKAYELLDSLSINATLRHAVHLLSLHRKQKAFFQLQQDKINPSIMLLAKHKFKYKEGLPMNIMDKTALLRRVKLFESVPVESLQAIAEICHERDMAAGEYIFKDTDETDHFYCIVSGMVTIKKGDHILSELHEADYFGELGVLDGMPRTANAIASHNGALLYIEKEEFLNVLEDLPEIMRAVVGQIIRYLRQNIKDSFLTTQ